MTVPVFHEQENDCVVESLDLSDDEDLQQSLDLHGLIISSQTEVQPIKTADEVISEIEEMMQVSPDIFWDYDWIMHRSAFYMWWRWVDLKSGI